MTDLTQRCRRWLMIQDSDRWTAAIHRFSPAMMPENLIASIASVRLEDWRDSLDDSLRNRQPSLLLWHGEPGDFITILDQITTISRWQTRNATHLILPVMAGDRFTLGQQLALAEIGIRVFLRHPEDLPRYGPLVRHHFATPDSPSFH